MSSVRPTPAEAFRFWLKLGFISFGGPAGQIAVMHTELVERRRWIGEQRFLHALNYCMLLPGPEATQLAIYCGWLLHRTRGGIVAGVLFILPSVVLLWALALVYVMFGQVPWLAAAFGGLKPAVTAIVAAAVLRIGQRTIRSGTLAVVAGAAFVAIFFLRVPFPWIVAASAALGFAAAWRRWPGFAPAAERAAADGGATPAPLDEAAESSAPILPSWRRAGRVVLVSLVVWWVPVIAVGAWQGWDGTLFREGVFFSQAAMVTFGGAYAVLPYVGQQAVEHFGWLSATQMLDGLGLAETTPGPLIMVVQFVGFLGGWHHPGQLAPLTAATLGALITTWTTFVPSFLWIFLGAPHLEQLRGSVRLGAALTAVTAAIVGVVLNLAVWFAGQVFWRPGSGIDGFAVAVAVGAFVALQRFKAGVVTVVLGSGLLGVARLLAMPAT